jgi:glycosyltransferase involved in cell wall biosynthesis
MQYNLSIVVPCYNEAQNIPFIIDAFSKIVKNNTDVEVLLVNNGSTDDSATIFKKALITVELPNIKLVTVAQNKGYGHGILEGLQNATAPVLSWTHADLQTDPFDVLKAYEVYKNFDNEMVLVKGKRRKRNFIDVFFTWCMQVYCNFKLSTALHDVNAQPKLFSRKFYDNIKQEAPLDFSLDLFFLYHAQRLGSIKTIDVFFKKRLHGEAKGGGTMKGKMKLIKRTFPYINELAKTITVK